MKNTNSELNHREFKERKIVLESYPRFLFIEFTRRCNLYCEMCRPQKDSCLNQFISDELLHKIETEVIPHAQCLDLRGWGESTLDDRLLPFMQKYAHDKTVFLFTNMNSRDSQYWSEVSKLPVHIILSIESTIPERYSLFRRGGNFAKLKSHLENFRNSNAKLYFNTIVSEKNMEDLKSIIELAAEYNVEHIQFNAICAAGPDDFLKKTFNFFCKQNSPFSKGKHNEKDLAFFGFTPTEYFFEKLREIELVSKKLNIKIEIGSNLNTLNNTNRGVCLQPWSYCYFSYNGDIGLCDHLLCNQQSMIGNIQDKNFMEVWNSKRAQNWRISHSEKNIKRFLFEKRFDCVWCHRNCYGCFEYFIEPEIKGLPLEGYIKLVEEIYFN